MMAARAAILPAGVSTVTSRPLQAMRLAGVDSASGTCSPSLAISVPRPWRQAIAALRSCARALSIDGDVLQVLAGGVGAEHEFRRPRPVAEILRQRRGAGHIGLAARGVVDGAVGAHQGGEKFLGFAGARVAAADADFLARAAPVTMSSPALRASLIIGLVSGLCIQRAPRSNGTSKVAVSVRQRPPIWPEASTTITLRFAAMDAPRRGDAGGARADHDNVGLARQRRAPTRARRAPASPQGPRTPTGNRGASLSCHGFRKL